jgi:hypothetical protein
VPKQTNKVPKRENTVLEKNTSLNDLKKWCVFVKLLNGVPYEIILEESATEKSYLKMSGRYVTKNKKLESVFVS